jgi:hypothetical protein
MSETAQGLHRDRLLMAVVAVLGLCCAAALWRAIAVTGLHVALDPNEGWNAYHAQEAARGGGGLYPGPFGFMFNNYPPLSFAIVGYVGRFFHDFIVAGRALSLLSFLAVALLIVAAARDMGCSAVEACFAGLLWAAYMLLDTDYVGMDDPQLMGEAFSLLGLVLLLGTPRGTLRVALAALALVVAGFIKHNLIAIPLAAMLWLAVDDPRASVRLVFWTAGFALLGYLDFRAVFGTDLFAHLDSPRVYSFAHLLSGLSVWLIWAIAPLAAIALLVAYERRDPFVLLVALLAGIATVLGAILIGGDGVDANSFFDADIALALGTALFLNRFAARGFRYAWIASLVFAAPLAVTLALNADADWATVDFWLHPMQDDAALAQNDVAFIRAHNGPALCETLTWCYWASKPGEIDVFNLGQAYRTGARTDDALASLIDARYFGVMEFDSLQPFALTPRIYERLLRNYRVDHTDDNGAFFVPKKK